MTAGPAIDRSKLLKHAGGHELIAAKIARVFLAGRGDIVATLRGALASDTDDRARIAHGARGGLGMVGAVGAVAICEAIEASASDVEACAALVDRIERELERAAAELADLADA